MKQKPLNPVDQNGDPNCEFLVVHTDICSVTVHTLGIILARMQWPHIQSQIQELGTPEIMVVSSLPMMLHLEYYTQEI